MGNVKQPPECMVLFAPWFSSLFGRSECWFFSLTHLFTCGIFTRSKFIMCRSPGDYSLWNTQWSRPHPHLDTSCTVFKSNSLDVCNLPNGEESKCTSETQVSFPIKSWSSTKVPENLQGLQFPSCQDMIYIEEHHGFNINDNPRVQNLLFSLRPINTVSQNQRKTVVCFPLTHILPCHLPAGQGR